LKQTKQHDIVIGIIIGVFMINSWNRDAVSYSSQEYSQIRRSNESFRRKYDVLREPQWFLERVEEAFGDVNFLSSRFDPAVDNILGEEQNQRIFVVPPFSLAARYLERAAIETKAKPDSTIIFLISARTEAFSWHDHVFGIANILFLKGPFRFIGLDKGMSASLIIFGKCSQEALVKLSDMGTIITPASKLTGN
jgi:hypothetical protein